MKRLIASLLLILGLVFSLGQGQALAEECIKTINQGSATVETGWFTQSAPTIAWWKGNITTDVKYDTCTPTAVVRLNGNDWNRLLSEGKLDGIRYEVYQYAEKDGNFQNFLFRQVKG
ncbi:MAG: hypothetical protein ACREPR_07925, partial [Brasilonema sp.]